MSTTVHTQAELDAALTDKAERIIIDSPRGVWLTVRDSDSSSVVAWGSSSVVAWGSSSVVAWDSSSVVARGSSSVVARGAATLHAWSTTTASAGPRCAVFLHRADLKVDGGIQIDVIEPDKTAATWCDWHGVEVIDGQAIVYKAVDDAWTTSRGFVYEPGAHLTAPDWRDDDECGGGLHFGPTPHHARDYNSAATRYVKVSVPVDASRPIPGGTAKIKARECLVLGEVTIDRKPVGEVAS